MYGNRTNLTFRWSQGCSVNQILSYHINGAIIMFKRKGRFDFCGHCYNIVKIIMIFFRILIDAAAIVINMQFFIKYYDLTGLSEISTRTHT